MPQVLGIIFIRAWSSVGCFEVASLLVHSSFSVGNSLLLAASSSTAVPLNATPAFLALSLSHHHSDFLILSLTGASSCSPNHAHGLLSLTMVSVFDPDGAGAVTFTGSIWFIPSDIQVTNAAARMPGPSIDQLRCVISIFDFWISFLN